MCQLPSKVWLRVTSLPSSERGSRPSAAAQRAQKLITLLMSRVSSGVICSTKALPRLVERGLVASVHMAQHGADLGGPQRVECVGQQVVLADRPGGALQPEGLTPREVGPRPQPRCRAVRAVTPMQVLPVDCGHRPDL